VHDAIRLKHYAYSTEKTYVFWAKRFVLGYARLIVSSAKKFCCKGPLFVVLDSLAKNGFTMSTLSWPKNVIHPEFRPSTPITRKGKAS
jgi:hypothetical protein